MKLPFQEHVRRLKAEKGWEDRLLCEMAGPDQVGCFAPLTAFQKDQLKRSQVWMPEGSGDTELYEKQGMLLVPKYAQPVIDTRYWPPAWPDSLPYVWAKLQEEAAFQRGFNIFLGRS